MSGTTLVIGLGRTDRGDDGVGPAVARLLARRLADRADVLVLVEEEPTALLDTWEGHDDVVVVDAVVAHDPPGTVHRLEVGADSTPLSAATWAVTGRQGTHGFGLAAAVELARALHRLPARVLVVGVEAGVLEPGAPLSPPVAAAVGRAAALVGEEVTGGVPGRAG